MIQSVKPLPEDQFATKPGQFRVLGRTMVDGRIQFVYRQTLVENCEVYLHEVIEQGDGQMIAIFGTEQRSYYQNISMLVCDKAVLRIDGQDIPLRLCLNEETLRFAPAKE